MHRRNRHYNPGNSGAAVFVDARLIRNASDNTRILSWSPARWIDLSGNNNHIVGQGDSVRDPLYIASSTNLNGLPAVRHTIPSWGSITSTFGSNSFPVTANNLSVIVLASNGDTNSQSRLVSFNATGASDQATSGWGALVHAPSSSGTTPTTSTVETWKDSVRHFSSTNNYSTINKPYIYTAVMNGTAINTYLNKTAFGPFTISSTMNSNEVWFGRNTAEGGLSRWGGDFGCITIFRSSITNALRQRVGVAFAFRYKTQFA
jgi:hypothetical protein